MFDLRAQTRCCSCWRRNHPAVLQWPLQISGEMCPFNIFQQFCQCRMCWIELFCLKIVIYFRLTFLITAFSRQLCCYLAVTSKRAVSPCVNIRDPCSFPLFLDRPGQDPQLSWSQQGRECPHVYLSYLSLCCSVSLGDFLRDNSVSAAAGGARGSHFLVRLCLQGTADFFRELNHHLQPSPCAHHAQHHDQPQCVQRGSAHRVPGLLRAGLAHPFLPMPAQHCVRR